MADKYMERVLHGAQTLDSLCEPVGIIPRNWRTLIDTNTLNLHDECFCILGQIGQHLPIEGTGHGDSLVTYGDVLDALFPKSDPRDTFPWEKENGFNTDQGRINSSLVGVP